MMDIEDKIRRDQNNLVIAGSGIILMAVWSVIKGVMEISLPSDHLVEVFKGLEGNHPAKVVASIMILYILSVDAILHFYIGNCARIEGHGEDMGKAYLVWLGISIFFSILSTISNVTGFNEKYMYNELSQLLFDLTSLYMYIDAMILSIKIKSRRKKRKE